MVMVVPVPVRQIAAPPATDVDPVEGQRSMPSASEDRVGRADEVCDRAVGTLAPKSPTSFAVAPASGVGAIQHVHLQAPLRAQ